MNMCLLCLIRKVTNLQQSHNSSKKSQYFEKFTIIQCKKGVCLLNIQVTYCSQQTFVALKINFNLTQVSMLKGAPNWTQVSELLSSIVFRDVSHISRNLSFLPTSPRNEIFC